MRCKGHVCFTPGSGGVMVSYLGLYHTVPRRMCSRRTLLGLPAVVADVQHLTLFTKAFMCGGIETY